MTVRPPGVTSSVSFTFDVDAEEVWLGEDPENAIRPVVLSQGSYGPRVGLPSILEIAARHGVAATFFFPGRVAQIPRAVLGSRPDTLELVQQFGFRYSSNFMSDIRPFRHAGTDLIELPVHWILDDAAHFWFSGDTWTKKISTNAEVDEILTAEATGIARLGGTVIYTFHPQIIGRPGRLPLLDQAIARATADPQVWVATAADIADDARKKET